MEENPREFTGTPLSFSFDLTDNNRKLHARTGVESMAMREREQVQDVVASLYV